MLRARGRLWRTPGLYRSLSAVVNIFRSIPFIILLVWMIPFTRIIVGTSIGLQAAIVPLTVGAAPFIARMVENALLEIPAGLIEASRAMGATPLQIVRKILLPEALPGLVNAATITLITWSVTPQWAAPSAQAVSVKSAISTVILDTMLP